MLTKHTGHWKLRDWFILLVILAFGIPLLLAAVHGVAPGSGFDHALHQGGQTIANFLFLVARGLNAAGEWFSSL